MPDTWERPIGALLVRGGAFDNNQNNARVGVRNNNHPNNRNNNVGMRVVAHIFPLPYQKCCMS
jgi:formylglycine-generating enzyme required for sulfatase activity